jgi:hypothetical protein
MGGRFNPEGMEPNAFTGCVRPLNVCGFTAAEVGSNAHRVERTHRDVRLDGADDYFTMFQVAGKSAMTPCMVRPRGARGFRRSGRYGLASMYPASAWSCVAPGHHGYQRACDLINGQASSGAMWVTSVRVRREDRSSISTHPLADLGRVKAVGYVINSSSCYAVPLFAPRTVPSSRPARGLTSRARPVKAGRRADLASRVHASRPMP